MDGRVGSFAWPAGGSRLFESELVRDEACEHGADHGGVHERTRSVRRLGADLVEVVARLVELVVGFDLPAHTVDVGDLVGTHRWGKIGKVEAIAPVGRGDPHQASEYLAGCGAEGDLASSALPSKTSTSCSSRASRSVPAKKVRVT